MLSLTAAELSVKLTEAEMIRVTEARHGAYQAAGAMGGTFRDMTRAAEIAERKTLAAILGEQVRKIQGDDQFEDFPRPVRPWPRTPAYREDPREYVRGADSDDLPTGGFLGHDD